jgi:threonine dehydratase
MPNYCPEIEDVVKANIRLKKILDKTPLVQNLNLSERYKANVMLKREDLQIVRSYKIRGAYNKIRSLSAEEVANGIVCASAGNHAQGVAYSCKNLKIKGRIYMPVTTPNQKIKQVKMFGKEYVEIILTGDTFDEANERAIADSEKRNMAFIPPFDDPKVIEGQATIGLEILEQTQEKIDYIFIPVGGGGLISGLGSFFKKLSPHTKIIGVEPAGAPSLKTSLEKNEIVTLNEIDKFVDGAAVKRIGNLTFEIARQVTDRVITIPEGKVCSTILQLYNEEAIVVEPAGALSVSALDFFKDEIVGKNVICIISGSNNDITRTEEIKERSLLYEGLKHYFLIRFAQRAGALREFVTDILGPTDDIVFFEYSKKNSRERGPALIGIVVNERSDFEQLIERMKEKKIAYDYLNDKPELLTYMI